VVEVGGDETEDGVHAGGHGDRHRQNVVHQEGTARDQPWNGTNEFGGHQIAPAPGGELFDDLGITGGKEENGGGHGQAQGDGEVGVVSQGAEGFFRAVTGGGEPIGAQAHPGKKGDQGNVMKNMGVQWVFGPSEQPFSKLCEHCERPQRKKKRPVPKERDGSIQAG
jgi:hypothetical protein